ncbi:MAG TPA: hypothetical protein VNP97_08350, partial [Microbacterium sp.]|nr:hypothetical protein [Microbacterium sp.]
AFIVLLLALVPPVVSRILVDSSATSGVYTLVIEATVIVLGIGGAWLAAVIDRRVRSRSRERSAVRPDALREPV